MKQAKQKLGKSGGFTLVEMLIVVAIIAILIAVSIPLISSALEKARHAVDDANRRDAIALGTVMYLTDDLKFDNTTSAGDNYNVNAGLKCTDAYNYVVTNSQGELKDSGTGVSPQCTQADASGSCKKYPASDIKLTVIILEDGTVATSWDKAAATTE